MQTFMDLFVPSGMEVNMKYENMIGKSFNNFEQRIIYSFIATYPEFMPAGNGDANVEEQKQLYTFLRNSIETIYDNLNILGFKKLLPDDCYNGEAAKEKPHIYTNMKKIEKSLYSLYTLIIDIYSKGEIQNKSIYIKNSILKLDKNKLRQLSQIGIQSQIEDDGVIIWSEEYPEFLSAFPILIDNVKKENGNLNIKKFIFCIFNDKAITAYNMSKNLLNEPKYIKEIDDFLEKLGYKNIFDKGDRNGYSKEYPNKQTGSFFSRFESRQKYQLRFEAYIPNFRLLLQYYDEMDNDLKNLTYTRLKVCDGCGYCTQTDKTGKRKPVCMKLTYNGETKNKCPLYPWFVWNDIDEVTMRSIIKLFEFAEKNYGI